MEKQEVALQPRQSPDALIELAVKGGADLEKIEKLLTLRERFEANEARKAYHNAMAAFKSNPPKIDKDKTVSYKTQAGTTTYNHATLANVTEKISTELSKHGLSASWTTKQNGAILVTCKITHIMGHSEETTLSAPADASGSKNAIQAIGSTITYLERYTLLALTGLATYDQDDDGQAASPAIEYISNKEQNQIADLLAEINAPLPDLLKYLKLESLEVMPKDMLPKALAAIEARKNSKPKGKK